MGMSCGKIVDFLTSSMSIPISFSYFQSFTMKTGSILFMETMISRKDTINSKEK